MSISVPDVSMVGLPRPSPNRYRAAIRAPALPPPPNRVGLSRDGLQEAFRAVVDWSFRVCKPQTPTATLTPSSILLSTPALCMTPASSNTSPTPKPTSLLPL